MKDVEGYRIDPGSSIHLADFPTRVDGEMNKDESRRELLTLKKRLSALQEVLYAENRHALLVVFQAMDTGGKDSTIRSIFTGVNPTGCRVESFKQPSTLELSHDFLWRAHLVAPRRGQIVLFNRSHYEDVLVVRVKELIPKERWHQRYEHINAFEELLHDEGTTIIKFFLHISKAYQKKRLIRRLKRPEKLWKFDPNDLAERARWDAYQEAYEDAISKCSKRHAPWYVIPAECRRYRNVLIARALVKTLESLDMKPPTPSFDPKTIVVD